MVARLAGAALERMGYEARCGALFIYFGKRRDAVKALFFDGCGWRPSHAAERDGRFWVNTTNGLASGW